jgi:protein phosphatase
MRAQNDDILDIADVTGKRVLQTAIFANLTVPEDQSASALEWMSRFAVSPRWLIYLPPTMSPPETSKREGYLEYPTEALEYFRAAGAQSVICEEKHMGSRAVVVVCKDAAVAAKRFGGRDGQAGVVYSRTGRAFFSGAALEKEFLERFVATLTKADFWAKFNSDWFCFDAEIMPWSLKAQSLLREQYAAVGAASRNSLSHVLAVLNEAKHSGKDTEKLIQTFSAMAENADKFTTAYRGYCWNVSSLADIKIAPFHILASEGAVPHR